jgi:hypothetical protein
VGYRARSVTQDWNGYPLHEGCNAGLAGVANPAPWVPSASRAQHAAHVSGHAGHYTGVFTAAAGASVTLRTDAAGSSITETITGAYQVAS